MSLPEVLVASDVMSALTSAERRAFEARIRHVIEVAQQTSGAVALDRRELTELIDNLELDALSILSAGSSTMPAITPYVVHSSWTASCTGIPLRSYLAPELVRFLESAPSSNFSTKGMGQSVEIWGDNLTVALRGLASASAYEDAISHLLAIDALLARHLQFAVLVRLNV